MRGHTVVCPCRGRGTNLQSKLSLIPEGLRVPGMHLPGLLSPWDSQGDLDSVPFGEVDFQVASSISLGAFLSVRRVWGRDCEERKQN